MCVKDESRRMSRCHDSCKAEFQFKVETICGIIYDSLLYDCLLYS